MKRPKNTTLLQAFMLTLAIVCLFIVMRNNSQADTAIPLSINFEGEYSRDGESWQPYSPDISFSALEGDLYLRGHFDHDLPEKAAVYFFSDHITSTVYVDGQLVHIGFVQEMDDLGLGLTPTVCAQTWSAWGFENGLSSSSELEIRLHNPHVYGNKNAYNDLLGSLKSTPLSSNLLALYLEPYGDPFRIAGLIVLILAIILVGAAGVAAAMRIPNLRVLWKCGMLLLFAGGFIILDTVNISLTQNLYAFNTYGKHLCMMMFTLWLGLCMLDRLSQKTGKVARIVVLVSAVADTVMIVFSFTGVCVIYETLPWWTLSQLIISPSLIVLGIMDLRTASNKNRIFLISVMLLLLAVIPDLFGVGTSIYSRGTCTKFVFALLLLLHIALTSRFIISNQQASILAEKLKKDLEESRITIMLSQIQPHFLYNTLGTIRELCHKDPKEAENATVKFSDFLRKNMDSLSIDKPIPFENELMHTRNYLELEQLRFGDQLRITYDIQTYAFKLPTLTLQPIVENAVRHGVRKNEDGGEVLISTREYEDRFEVSVRDNGPGFDTGKPVNDGRSHVGIKNVRERLFMQCGGDLKIISSPGNGTSAIIIIKKTEEDN